VRRSSAHRLFSMKDDMDNSDIEKVLYEKNKYYQLYKTCKKWIKNLQTGTDLNNKLNNSNINRVAIYGWGELAWMLANELCADKIAYIIDRNAESISAPFDAFTPESDLPNSDLIIVTILDQFDLIKEQLKVKTNIPICSLDDLVCEDKWGI